MIIIWIEYIEGKIFPIKIIVWLKTEREEEEKKNGSNPYNTWLCMYVCVCARVSDYSVHV
jgi:hypothetical protein